MHQQSATLSSDPEDQAEKIARLEVIVRRLSERQEIIDVYRRYTRGLNRYDIDLLTGVFWPNAQINYGYDTRLRDEWIAYWQHERHLKSLACQAHHITNETIDIVEDVAHVETYLIACRVNKQDRSACVFGGRYIDRLDRRNGEWRIAVREFIPHFLIEGASRLGDLAWPITGPGAGTCDKRDPSYWRPLTARSDSDGKT